MVPPFPSLRRTGRFKEAGIENLTIVGNHPFAFDRRKKNRGGRVEIPQERVKYTLENVVSPGRGHVARMLVEEGVVESSSEAFEQYLGEGSPAFVKKDKMNTEDAIDLLRNVGAVPERRIAAQ